MKLKRYTVIVEYAVPNEPSRAASGNYVGVEYVAAYDAADAKRRAAKWYDKTEAVVMLTALRGSKLWETIVAENQIQ